MSILNNIWVKRIPIYVVSALLLYHLRYFLYPDFDGSASSVIFGVFHIVVYCIGCIGIILTFFTHIKSAITKTSEIGCDHKGIFLDDGFVPWDNILEFRTSRDTLFYKSVLVVEKRQEENVQIKRNIVTGMFPKPQVRVKSNIFTRLFLKSRGNRHGTVHKITPDQFNGSAESFVAYLKGEKKRYGKE